MKISYYGYLTPFGGYGIANLQWVKHLKRQGVDVSVNAKFRAFPGSDEWEVLTAEEREIFEKPFERRKVGIIETTPANFQLLDTDVKIANTMAEGDRIGPEWVAMCQLMDYVIVPNDFYRRVFRDSGVTKPITVIPHGVDTERYSYYERPPREIFTFGSCGYLNNRKGVFELIRAFSSEFDLQEPVRLRLHTTDPDLGFYKNLNDPRIEITDELWNFPALVRFYHHLDCFVFPSRAEGIGYPPREAMASGLPVILMNWSGLEDIAELGYPLTPSGFEAVNPMIEQPGNWAKIDIPELMYWMRWVYEHKQEAYNKGTHAAKVMKEEYSWPISALKLKKFLEPLCQK